MERAEGSIQHGGATSGKGSLSVGLCQASASADEVLPLDLAPRKRMKRQMSLKDELRLSPYQKWRRYRAVPWSLILHLLVLVLSTFLQVAVTNERSSSLAELRKDLAFVFYPDQCTSTWAPFCANAARCNILPPCRLQTVQDLQATVNASVYTFFELDDRLIADISPHRGRGVQLRVRKRSGVDRNYTLTADSDEAALGPLYGTPTDANATLRRFLDDMEFASLDFEVTVRNPSLENVRFLYPGRLEHLRWNVLLRLHRGGTGSSMLLDMALRLSSGPARHGGPSRDVRHLLSDAAVLKTVLFSAQVMFTPPLPPPTLLCSSVGSHSTVSTRVHTYPVPSPSRPRAATP